MFNAIDCIRGGHTKARRLRSNNSLKPSPLRGLGAGAMIEPSPRPQIGPGLAQALGLTQGMDASSKDGFLAVLGLTLVVYGLGMAILTWRNPRSLYYPIFRPRWRFGVEASRGAAFVQVPLYLSLGGIFLFGAFHSTHAKICFYIFVASTVLSVGIFFVDWASSGEP